MSDVRIHLEHFTNSRNLRNPAALHSSWTIFQARSRRMQCNWAVENLSINDENNLRLLLSLGQGQIIGALCKFTSNVWTWSTSSTVKENDAASGREKSLAEGYPSVEIGIMNQRIKTLIQEIKYTGKPKIIPCGLSLCSQHFSTIGKPYQDKRRLDTNKIQRA